MNERHWVRPLFALACTRWGWSADAFWQSTPMDLKMILDGLQSIEATQQRGMNTETLEQLHTLILQHKEKSHGV